MKETGTLTIGVMHGGKRHKTFTLGPQLARYGYEASEENPGASQALLGFCVLAKMLESLGEIPREEITGQLLWDELHEADHSTLMKKKEVLEGNLVAFSEGAAGSQEAGDSSAQGGALRSED